MSTAATETDCIVVAALEARDALSYFAERAYNGFGELADPSTAARYLSEATKALALANAAYDRACKAGWSREE